MRYTSGVRRVAPFLLLAATAVGCHLIGGTSDYVIGDAQGGAATTTSSGMGGTDASTSSSSSSTSGTGGAPPQCVVPADCMAGPCQNAECNGGMCDYTDKGMGTQCLGPSMTEPGVCSIEGLCVECIDAEHCPGVGDTCEPNNTCKANHCENTQQDVDEGETDIDCGGPCPPCGLGDGCSVPGDCDTLFCSGNLCANCTTPDSCVTGFYCHQSDFTCVPKKPNGSSCVVNLQSHDYLCSSGCCALGFCALAGFCN